MSHCDETLRRPAQCCKDTQPGALGTALFSVHQEEGAVISLPPCDTCEAEVHSREDPWVWLGDAPGGGGSDRNGGGNGVDRPMLPPCWVLSTHHGLTFDSPT